MEIFRSLHIYCERYNASDPHRAVLVWSQSRKPDYLVSTLHLTLGGRGWIETVSYDTFCVQRSHCYEEADEMFEYWRGYVLLLTEYCDWPLSACLVPPAMKSDIVVCFGASR
jgi:hypothetical protein